MIKSWDLPASRSRRPWSSCCSWEPSRTRRCLSPCFLLIIWFYSGKKPNLILKCCQNVEIFSNSWISWPLTQSFHCRLIIFYYCSKCVPRKKSKNLSQPVIQQLILHVKPFSNYCSATWKIIQHQLWLRQNYSTTNYSFTCK